MLHIFVFYNTRGMNFFISGYWSAEEQKILLIPYIIASERSEKAKKIALFKDIWFPSQYFDRKSHNYLFLYFVYILVMGVDPGAIYPPKLIFFFFLSNLL